MDTEPDAYHLGTLHHATLTIGPPRHHYHVLQAAAASLVYGTLQLTLAVHRSARAAPLASAVVLLAAPRCAQAALALPAACGRVLCPWHVAAQQQQLHLSRLVVLAATLLQPHMQQQQQPQHLAAAGSGTVPEGGEDGGKGTKAAPAAAAAQAGVLPVPPLVLMDTCLSVLSHAPAGAEALCLQALRLALCGELLRPLLQLAHKEAAALASAHPQLALAAAGVPNGSSTGSAGAGGLTGVLFSAPYPLPPGPPDADEAAEVLFESFAASWLSLIAQRRLEGGANQRRAGGSEAEGVEEGQQQGRARPAARVQLAPLTLGLCQLQQQAGSRLAAPPQWMMLEAHRLPATGGGGQQQHATPPPLHPVGCALMLCLGMEAAPGGSQLLRGLPAGSKEAAALQAAFVFRAGEMLAEEQRQQGRGRGPRGQGGDGDGDADESWREPLVRWALAGLSQRYLCKGGGSAVSWMWGLGDFDMLAMRWGQACCCRTPARRTCYATAVTMWSMANAALRCTCRARRRRPRRTAARARCPPRRPPPPPGCPARWLSGWGSCWRPPRGATRCWGRTWRWRCGPRRTPWCGCRCGGKAGAVGAGCTRGSTWQWGGCVR